MPSFGWFILRVRPVANLAIVGLCSRRVAADLLLIYYLVSPFPMTFGFKCALLRDRDSNGLSIYNLPKSLLLHKNTIIINKYSIYLRKISVLLCQISEPA